MEEGDLSFKHSQEWLCEQHSLETLQYWVNSLSSFYFFRAVGGHANDPDYFATKIKFDDAEDAKNILYAFFITEITPENKSSHVTIGDDEWFVSVDYAGKAIFFSRSTNYKVTEEDFDATKRLDQLFEEYELDEQVDRSLIYQPTCVSTERYDELRPTMPEFNYSVVPDIMQEPLAERRRVAPVKSIGSISTILAIISVLVIGYKLIIKPSTHNGSFSRTEQADKNSLFVTEGSAIVKTGVPISASITLTEKGSGDYVIRGINKAIYLRKSDADLELLPTSLLVYERLDKKMEYEKGISVSMTLPYAPTPEQVEEYNNGKQVLLFVGAFAYDSRSLKPKAFTFIVAIGPNSMKLIKSSVSEIY